MGHRAIVRPLSYPLQLPARFILLLDGYTPCPPWQEEAAALLKKYDCRSAVVCTASSSRHHQTSRREEKYHDWLHHVLKEAWHKGYVLCWLDPSLAGFGSDYSPLPQVELNQTAQRYLSCSARLVLGGTWPPGDYRPNLVPFHSLAETCRATATMSRGEFRAIA